MDSYTKKQEENQELPNNGQTFEIKFENDTKKVWYQARRLEAGFGSEHFYQFAEDWTTERYTQFELTQGDIKFRQVQIMNEGS